MDYQEAIDVLANEIGCVDLDTNNRGYINESEQKFMDACNTAISAMHELQPYKDGKLCLIPESVYSKQCAELDAYKQLGTLEEVREAMEKQKRKKPYASNRCYVCPHCGLVTSIKIKHNYCDACGQRISWEE